MTDMPLVFSMPGHRVLGARFAKALYIEGGALTVRRCPDGYTPYLLTTLMRI